MSAVFGRWADLVKLILGAGLWLFFLYMAAARFLEEPVSVSHIVFWSGLFLVYNLSFLKYWSNKRKTAGFSIEDYCYLDKRDKRMRFNNSKDPIYYVFDCIENRPVSTLAKEFVKDTLFEITNFVSKVVG